MPVIRLLKLSLLNYFSYLPTMKLHYICILILILFLFSSFCTSSTIFRLFSSPFLLHLLFLFCFFAFYFFFFLFFIICIETFENHTHLIIDEVHERSVDGDLLCLLARRFFYHTHFWQLFFIFIFLYHIPSSDCFPQNYLLQL